MSPANIGGMALNIRFMQKCGVDPAGAAAGVGLNSLAGGIMHVLLLRAFFTWTGTELGNAFALPSSSKLLLALAVVVAVVGVVLATRWGRRTVLRRLTGGLRAAAGDLRRVAKSPAKLALLFGGSAATTLAYIGGFAAAVMAFGGGPSIAQVGTVYLAGAGARGGGAHPWRPRTPGGGPRRGPRRAGHGRGSGRLRGAHLPAGDVLAADPARMAVLELPAASGLRLTVRNLPRSWLPTPRHRMAAAMASDERSEPRAAGRLVRCCIATRSSAWSPAPTWSSSPG